MYYLTINVHVCNSMYVIGCGLYSIIYYVCPPLFWYWSCNLYFAFNLLIHIYIIFCLCYIAEEDRKQFYEVIGYSEDEEYIEYPKEV